MHFRWRVVPLALGVVFLVVSAAAQTEEKKAEKKSAGPKTESPAKEGAPGQGTVRRDPQGITGISPYMETVNKGNAAYVGKDFAAAADAYRDAIGKEPKKPLAHYLLGEALLASGKLDEADQTWQNALHAAGNDNGLQAKVLFVIADLRERQGKWDEAATAWKDYATFVGAHPDANGYAATATERQKVIDTHKDLAVKYGKVKERIQQRLEEASKGEPPKTEPPKKK